MRARLADIAAQAGVSEATVSRVLNGRPGVAEHTRQAVLTALDVLGFERPARLRRRGTGLVGLIVPELDNPVFPAIAQSVERALAQYGHTPVLCTQIPGGFSEDDYTEMLMERGVSGIVFVSGLHSDSTADTGRYTRLLDRGLPMVFVNGCAEGLQATFVSSDEAGAAQLSVHHLADLGHRRIGLAVGPLRYVPTARKAAGFRAAMAERFGPASDVARAAALPEGGLLEQSLFTVEGGQAAAGPLLDRGATALICANDLMALGAIRTVRQRGLRVPEDVSVVGYDDSPLIGFTDPPLTTVRQPVHAMGQAAVRALQDAIAGDRPPRTELLFAPELVVRASTAPAPAPVPTTAPAPESWVG
ncbi:LacI family DNA-binding transcriptional regulator [Allostreptomyces psammosilenae]|uniref:DNA-binding LacI/PurR family transcriptional regulator n=1 Tax=Allostreptomyces psammosilenae TaxID=1892865 RepID=A0A853A0C3_9ACTN|nr:LacI family DNA-binding transcriptional regulator [Allostreptomyces psammosilenae]NYI07567.1 DNA-binding LacI/PurR family transcriptional regulator [Allostreptomyces psammosilenae]